MQLIADLSPHCPGCGRVWSVSHPSGHCTLIEAGLVPCPHCLYQAVSDGCWGVSQGPVTGEWRDRRGGEDRALHSHR